jgi:LysM repeat protein
MGVLPACSGEESAFTTLPPIRTTTTTTTTPETDQNRIFYQVKSGESLSIIARSFGVTVDSIVELNKISNPNTIEVGLIIEIPRDVVLVDELPEPPPEP